MTVLNRKKRKLVLALPMAMLIVACALLVSSAEAVPGDVFPQGTFYMSEESAMFDINESEQVDNLYLGSGKIGTFIMDSPTIWNLKSLGISGAYASEEDVTLSYTYVGKYQGDDEYSWNLVSSDAKTVNGINTGKIKLGAFVVERSYDGENWEVAAEPIVNLFSSKTERYPLYIIPMEDCLVGTYYRVTVAYEMQKRVEGSRDYEHASCMEVYSFYIGNNGNPVVLYDALTWQMAPEGGEVREGFIIDFPDMKSSVLLIDQEGNTHIVSGQELVCEKGTYTVKTVTSFGTQYDQTITVTEGMTIEDITPSVYANSDLSDGYSLENTVSGNTVFGYPSYTSLTVAQVSDEALSMSGNNYGISGESVYLFLSRVGEEALETNGWEILYDTWGKKDKETVAGVDCNCVCTGALIVQTSEDGINWENIEDGRYADGLYTTDFDNNYFYQNHVMIYMPDGEAVLNGLYVRVLYAYAVGSANGKENYRMLEVYNLYLCRDELDAVTIHNLTAQKQIVEQYGDYDQSVVEEQKYSETMQSGDCTVTGFTIDVSGNPTVTYTVERNGTELPKYPAGTEYCEDGKYEITLYSATGETKEIVIYVDTRSEEKALNAYFKDADDNVFITGKRIYSEGDIPVYEAGKTYYYIGSNKVSYLPISGTLTNLTTGEITELSSASGSMYRDIDTAGEYEAVFTNNPNYGTDNASGDIRVFTFRFEIIAEGTAPGPQVNQNLLEEYSHSTVADAYPIYYGVTVPSAQKGNITRAFATEEAALEYARTFESGIVEVQEDGTYRYTGSLPGVSQKVTYEANIDVMDAVEYFARQSVERLCFDSTNPASVLTLEQKVLDETDNIRKLELNSSVVIFADDEQRAELTDLDALPIISDKQCRFLQAGAYGEIIDNVADFEFIKDDDGYDSDSVTITDAAGTVVNIAYGESVGAQLAENNCVSGVVTINEQTVYGDAASYEAVYIADGENTAAVTLNYYAEGVEKSVVLTQTDDGTTITADSFWLSDITDELDPYSLVVINDGKAEYFYAIDDLPDTVWTSGTDYSVKITNRLGYSWSFTVSVSGAYYSEISFEGEGTEDIADVLTYYGAENVTLETPNRYGYDFAGYTDEDGTVYTDEIAQVLFKGVQVLEAQWTPKQVEIVLQDQNGNELDTVTVSYGDTYTLPEETETGYEFLGWSQDGIELEDNKLTVKTEDTVVVRAIMGKAANAVEAEAASGETGTSENVSTGEKTSSGGVIWFIIAVVVVVAAPIIVIVVKKRCLNTNRKDSMSEGDKQ